jgi:hypothetical protein
MKVMADLKKEKSRFFGLIAAIILCVVALFQSECFISDKTVVERGAPIDSEALSKIQIGKTTRSEIFSLLGSPNSIIDGQSTLWSGELINYYGYIESREISSLDDKHYAFLYKFNKSQAKEKTTFVVIIGARSNKISIKGDELLIIFNKNTNIVEDLAYRQEIKD